MSLAVIGLGNPGNDYEGTRHNAGKILLDHVSSLSGIPLEKKQGEIRFGEGVWRGERVYLVFPETFMNLSGRVVPWLRLHGVELPSEWLILSDDLDTPFGMVRFREKGGSGGQRGIRSIIQTAGSEAIARVKFGIGRPIQIGADISQYVLSPFTREERLRIPELLQNGGVLVERWVEAHSLKKSKG